MKSFKQYINEEKKSPRITLWLNPKYLGATPHTDNFDDIPNQHVPITDIKGIEPEDKMNIPSSQHNMQNIAKSIRNGENIPPILLRKHEDGYQILDGHHRFYAHKLVGSPTIISKVVPDEDIHVRHDVPK
jgi:hypothetical protein